MATARKAQTNDATETTRAMNAAVLQALPFQDTEDFASVERGRIAEPSAGVIKATSGRPVWEMEAYAFEDTDQAPTTVNPSLWRQAHMNRAAGLFKVVDRVYQVRGLDLSNMSIIEGDTGLIVIDPMISTECAAAGMDLYYQHRGSKPVVALIYTHSHVDHFGGVKGVISEDDVKAGKIQIFAPVGFMEHAVAENVYAGTAMSRRSHYMYGGPLPKNARGQVDVGLGKGASTGTITLIEPTVDISEPHSTRTIDGVEIEFQLTPGTEAPAEMNFYFPQFRALCAAENATHNQHNLLTLRGAEVRDPKVWAHYLSEAIDLFADRSDALFASHHWPTWGTENIRTFLADQRDMYEYLHDQTLRLINHGYTPMEIAETLKSLPPNLEKRWYCRGYYGSNSHNVRAVYQHYMGFYDGNPAHLNPLTPVDAGKRYVEAMGGADKVLATAREAYQRGEYRWTAQLLDHLVFAEPGNTAARQLEADAMEQLGYQSENGTWRSLYLMGALELRNGVGNYSLDTVGPDMIRAMTVPQYFDYMGVRLIGEKAATLGQVTLNWNFTDLKEKYVVTVRNGALTYRPNAQDPNANATITLTKTTLDAITLGQDTFDKAIADGRIKVDGNAGKLTQLLGMLDTFELGFNIIEP